MNPFERHGIDHLSASSGNLFAAEPALWVMERLLKRSAPVGCAAHRGTAAERGVNMALVNPQAPLDDCVKFANGEYQALTALNGDPNREKEGAAVGGIVVQAAKELRQYGVPTPAPSEHGESRQHRIEIMLDGVPVPIVGYLDWVWDQHGLIVDLKSQLRLSSEIKDNHARQVSLYVHGTNRSARVAYTTPAKIAVYALEDVPRHVDAMRRIFLTMGRFLAVSADPHELAGLVVPDYDSFYWNNPIARDHGREVYGF